jgi:hypothetical protein
VRHYRALFVELLEVDDETEHADQVSNRDRDLADVHAHDTVERLR